MIDKTTNTNDLDYQISELKKQLKQLEDQKNATDLLLLDKQPKKGVAIVVYRSKTQEPIKCCKTFNQLFDFLQTKLSRSPKYYYIYLDDQCFGSGANISTETRLNIVRQLKDKDGWMILLSILYIGNEKTGDVVYEVCIQSEQLRYFENIIEDLKFNKNSNEDLKPTETLNEIYSWRLFD